MRIAAGVALAALLLLLGAELALRGGLDARVRILCVGDSLTQGADVAPEESYPHQLQLLLDEHSPGRFAVINLGVPGMASWQVRDWLPAQLARYAPAIVVLLAGVNDSWNGPPAARMQDPYSRFDGLLLRSALHRRLERDRSSRHLEAANGKTYLDGLPQRMARRCDRAGCEKSATWWIRHDDVLEPVSIDRIGGTPRTYPEIEDVGRLLSGAGISFVLLGYPFRPDVFGRVNAEIARAGRELGVPLVQLPPEERHFVTKLHPGPAVYREIARELALLIPDL